MNVFNIICKFTDLDPICTASYVLKLAKKIMNPEKEYSFSISTKHINIFAGIFFPVMIIFFLDKMGKKWLRIGIYRSPPLRKLLLPWMKSKQLYHFYFSNMFQCKSLWVWESYKKPTKVSWKMYHDYSRKKSKGCINISIWTCQVLLFGFQASHSQN